MSDPHRIDSLPVLVLYPHSRCNCRCIMCDIWKIGTVEEIGASDLERHARDIETLGVRWVVFSGGEPLMHSDLFRLSARMRAGGIRTTLLTTGLLLAGQASSVVHNIDDVIVSLDGPPHIHDRIRRVPDAFELLASGVRALHALEPDFLIAARSTVQKANFSHMRETVEIARELGLKSISFLATDLDSDAFNRPRGWPEARKAQLSLTAEETEALSAEIEHMISEYDRYRGFVVETPEKLRRIASHFRSRLGLCDPVAPRCNAPWVSAVVEADGTVRPCFFHNPIGNIGSQTLIDVINGPVAIEFRRNLDVSHNPVCRRCVCSLYLSSRPGDDEAGSSAVHRTLWVYE